MIHQIEDDIEVESLTEKVWRWAVELGEAGCTNTDVMTKFGETSAHSSATLSHLFNQGCMTRDEENGGGRGWRYRYTAVPECPPKGQGRRCGSHVRIPAAGTPESIETQRLVRL